MQRINETVVLGQKWENNKRGGIIGFRVAVEKVSNVRVWASKKQRFQGEKSSENPLQ
jgi:hypothetical protein